MNNWMDFQEISYERYAIGDYSKVIIFNFGHFIVQTSQILKFVRWYEVDAMHRHVVTLL
jgi:hypothetical protein